MSSTEYIIEKCAENNKQLCTTFMDYENAFDSVNAAAVMNALRRST